MGGKHRWSIATAMEGCSGHFSRSKTPSAGRLKGFHLMHRDFQWTRDPIRRRDFRRRKGRQRLRQCPLIHSMIFVLYCSWIGFYCLFPNRSSPLIVIFEVLCLKNFLLILKGLQLTSFPRPKPSTPPTIDVPVVAALLPILVQDLGGYLEWLQSQRNHLMHTLTGNTPASSSGSPTPKSTDPTPTTAMGNDLDHLFSQIKLSRSCLLSMRTSPATPPVSLPVMAPLNSSKTSGNRRAIRGCNGQKIFYSKRITLNPRLSCEFKNSKPKLQTQPTPPQRGTPGVVYATNEECKASVPPDKALLGGGSRARAQRRRLYRQWHRLSRATRIPLGPGKPGVVGGRSLKAAHGKSRKATTAKLFRQSVLAQTNIPVRKGQVVKPLTTPLLPYGSPISVGTQNVQGMTELLKHQAVQHLIQDRSLHVLFLTETHCKSYYSFFSNSALYVVNGNNKDPWGGGHRGSSS